MKGSGKYIARILWTCLLLASSGQYTYGQNNNVFSGGLADGFSVSCLLQVSGNPIFSGGSADGFDKACYLAPNNNNLFSGGNADGFAQACFLIPSSNLIFAGGSADGFDQACFLTPTNSDIFAGGNADGFAQACFLPPSNSDIFAGGNADGFAQACFIMPSQNAIFGGAAGDGFNESCFAQTASVLSTSGPTTICNGSTANLTVTIIWGTSPYTVVYNDGSANATVTNYVSGTNIPVTPTITTTYSLVSVTDANSNIGTGYSGTPTITVNPTPDAIATPAGQVICSGSSPITPIVISSSVGGTTYAWTRDNTATVTGIAANGTSSTISGILTNTTNVPVTVTFTITPTANGCPGVPITATVLVNPTPDATATPASQTVCSANVITTIALTGNVSGTTFNWTRDNTGSVTGIGPSGSGDISGTLTNTTFAPVTVTFTITPVANGCSGTPITATVLVNPRPGATATPPSQTACSGNAITTIVLTSNVSGTTYAWTRDNTATVTGIAANGTSSTISGILTNTTNVPVTVTFTITPTANGCPGVPITATVLVNPIPNATATPASQTICSANVITTIALTGNVSGTTFNWTRDNTGSVTGIGPSGSGDISGTLTNTTFAPVTVTFTITPVANGCSGTPITATVLVNPRPGATATPPSQTACSGNTIATIVLTSNVSGTTYTWTRDNTATVTGIAANGTSSTISGTLTNTTNVPVTVTFTITPTANGCPGVPITATVLVNPIPNATATPASQTICSANLITTIALTGNVSGTTFNWTRDNVGSVTGIGPSGSGDISGTLTNTTFAPVTVTFTITPVANGCSGTPITATVLVNPTPTITCPGNMTVASDVGTCTKVVTYTPTVTGTPVPTLSYVLTGATTGSGNGTGSGTAFRVGVTTVTITATNTCATVMCSFTITVTDSQLPQINTPPVNRTVCAGSNATFTVAAVTVPSAGGVLNYQWQQWNGSTWIPATGGSGATTNTFTLSNVTQSMNTNTYRVQVIGLCTTVNSAVATLFVNPLPTINLSTSIPPALLPTQTLIISATTNSSGGSFVWFKNGVAIPGVTGNTLGGLTVSDIGVYYVIYTDANGCITRSSNIEVTGLPSGNLYVYPVPNQGIFNVRFYNANNEQVTIRVFDAKGAEVYRNKTLTSIPYTTVNVNLNSSGVITNGVYIVDVRNESGKLIGSRKIIIYR